MFYDTLNEENIYKKVSEYDLFRYYIGDFQINTAFCSPIRTEYTPSFSIFESRKGTNQLLWKDWGVSESGNIIKLVQKLYNLNYYGALQKINNDFHLNLQSSAFEITSSNYNITFPSSVSSNFKKETKIEVAICSWRKEHIDYWRQYNITTQELEYYNVFPINYFKIEDKVFSCTDYNNPGYVYCIYDYEFKEFKYKIYRPFNKYKWFSNCKTSNIQGWDQFIVEPSNFVIISKSLKDIIVLRKMGYLAIAPQSENSELSSDFYHKLNHYVEDFLYFYDNDEAGIKNAQRESLKTGKSFIYIDPVYKSKDISDFVKDYNFEEAKILLESLL